MVRRPAVALVLAIVALAACGLNTPGGYPPLAMMRAEHAAKIAPPGSVALRTESAEPWNPMDGPYAGFYGHLFGTTLTADEVEAFYARELPKLGWKVDRPPIRGSTESKAWGWCKPRLFFRLAILDGQRAYDRASLAVPPGLTLVFDARVQGDTENDCPS